jgi:hypothetical protein
VMTRTTTFRFRTRDLRSTGFGTAARDSVTDHAQRQEACGQREAHDNQGKGEYQPESVRSSGRLIHQRLPVRMLTNAPALSQGPRA